MDNGIHTSFNAADRSYFAILKKEIHSIVLNAGFTERKVGEIDIIIAEMVSNLIKHAGGGELLVKLVREEKNEGVEIISIDNGPGMTDPVKMIADGMSTVNTLGHGLGSIKRLSDTFEIYSLKDWGTITLSRVYKKERPLFVPKPKVEIRAIVVAKPGEQVSGDGFYYNQDDQYLRVFLGDGLGHGQDAYDSVTKAIQSIEKNTAETSACEILRAVHKEVKKTRGLVGTMALYSFKDRCWRICGIGNIATRMHNGAMVKNYLSYNGILGHNIPTTLKEQEVENGYGQTIIMCSDGIRTRWDTQKYPGLFKYDPSILAAAIYKDYARKTDDMSVIIGRVNTKI